MNKYSGILFLFILALLITTTNTVSADDGGPNSDFWVTDHKTNCISVSNPEAVGNNSFLVFDYSAKVGQAQGKPWTIVEKGKCYEVNDGSEDIYLVKIVKGDERETFSNYRLYAPTDSIPHLFCKQDYDCSEIKSGYSITPMYLLGDNSVTVGPSETIHFTGINTNELFPTKYDFGFPVTYSSSMTPDEVKPILDNSSFVSASNLYTSLAKQLNSALQTCDSRVRAERQYSVSDANGDYMFLDLHNIVWRLANNKDAIIQTFNRQFNNGVPANITESKRNSLHEIDLMGCKTTFSSFIQAHQPDFNTIDRLAQEVVLKYSNALKNNSDDWFAPIILRNSAEITKITAFAKSPVVSSPDETKQAVKPTTLDEPTTEKKTDLLLHSENPFLRIYVWLPIVALLGIIAFVIFRRK